MSTVAEQYEELQRQLRERVLAIDAEVKALMAEREHNTRLLGEDPAKKKPGPVKGSKRKKKEVTTEPT